MHFPDPEFGPHRIDDVTVEMRNSPRPKSDWAGDDNGVYLYDGVRPGLRLHKQFRYTLPPGGYRVTRSWRREYVEVAFLDANALEDPDEAWVPRIQAIIDSLTTGGTYV